MQYGGNPSSRKLEAAKEAEKLTKKTGEDDILGQIFKPVQKVEKGELIELIKIFTVEPVI